MFNYIGGNNKNLKNLGLIYGFNFKPYKNFNEINIDKTYIYPDKIMDDTVYIKLYNLIDINDNDNNNNKYKSVSRKKKSGEHKKTKRKK